MRSTVFIAAALGATTAASTSTRVNRIIVVMMENHSFDNMLGWLPGVDGVNATGRCNSYNGTTYCATNRGAYEDPDPDHSVEGTAEQIFGAPDFPPGQEHNASAETMSGFVSSYAKASSPANAPTIMDCFTPQAVPVISTLAAEFTVIDTYHASVPACTFPNRLFQLSGTSGGYAANDVIMTAAGWPQPSIFARLSAANVSWRVYYTDVPSALLMRDARNISDLEAGRYRPISEFMADTAAGDLPFFTWVEPGFLSLPGQPETDQHPAADVADGERWMKAVYESVRASPLWNESAMLVTYDEHGGFYDHVAPLNTGVPSPDGLPCTDCSSTPFSFTRLGVRVPMVVVSPWAVKGRVVHEPAAPSGAYEHSSLAASLAALVPGFGGAITARAAWALPLHPLWEETPLTAPRTDCPTVLPAPPAQSPSQVGATRDGTQPALELQRLMVLLAEGVAAQLAGANMTEEAPRIEARLAAAGAFDSVGAAARHAVARMRSIMAYRGAAAVADERAGTPVEATCRPYDAVCDAAQRGADGAVQPSWVRLFERAAGTGPEQLWVNYGATPDAVAIRWATSSAAAQAVLAWGTAPDALTHVAGPGLTESYHYPGSPGYTSPFIHTVNVTGLPLNTTIYYQVGDAATGQSAVWDFPSNPGVGAGDAFFPYTTAFVADVGESDAANTTIQRVLAAKASAGVSSVVINGDIAYATGCEADGCTTWDAFGRLVEPLARTLPFAISLGNHEEDDTFDGIYAASSTYRFRGMPTGGRIDSGTGLQYFSWEAGPIHYLSFNCFASGLPLNTTQSAWIEADLAAVDRSRTPWIVATQHAPWYNTNTKHQGDGLPAMMAYEKLFIAAGVSAVFSGHVHAYERTTPVANFKVMPPGPGSMMHFNIGDGGASLYTKWEAEQPWSAYRNATWGHGRFVVLNKTHAFWSWHDNAVADDVLLDSTYVLNANPAVWQ